jgi:hypothetical protein
MGSMLAFDAISTIPQNNIASPTFTHLPYSPSIATTTLTLPVVNLQSVYSTQTSCPEYVLNASNVNNSQNNTTPTFDLYSQSSLQTNSINSFVTEHLEFNVSHFFSFGSLLGLLLAFRKYSNTPSTFNNYFLAIRINLKYNYSIF